MTLSRLDNSPAVSLLIPVYNVERYLGRCMESAVSQSLPNIELICLNDGSTDGSLDILKEYSSKDPRVKVVNKANSGYGSSMNRGLDEARGEYVGILESDDFFEPDALEVLYNAARRLDADVAKADFYLFWSEPEERNERFGWVDDDAPEVVSPIEYPEVFFRKPSIWSAIYRRNFLKSNGIRFLETPGASYQDTSFNFKVWACAKRAALVRKPVIHYRQDNETSSINSPGKAFCVCDEYREMSNFVDELPDGDKKSQLQRLLVRLRFDTYMWNYERLSEPLQREFLKNVHGELLQEDRRGFTDPALFDQEKFERRKLLVEYPDIFHLQNSPDVSKGKMDTLKRYYQAGGLPLVFDAAAKKFFHRGS